MDPHIKIPPLFVIFKTELSPLETHQGANSSNTSFEISSKEKSWKDLLLYVKFCLPFLKVILCWNRKLRFLGAFERGRKSETQRATGETQRQEYLVSTIITIIEGNRCDPSVGNCNVALWLRFHMIGNTFCNFIIMTSKPAASVVQCSEFLATKPEVSGPISGAKLTFQEEWRLLGCYAAWFL
jgi:hypothetical protein